MMLALTLALLLIVSGPQSADIPAYLRQGDRIEQVFRDYHSRLSEFYTRLREIVQSEAPDLVEKLEGEPPRPILYGYQLVPRLFDEPADKGLASQKIRSYSWTLTEGYIRGEGIKLTIATTQIDFRSEPLSTIVQAYRNLVDNQKTIDQHIEYNRFWQRAVAADRPRYDQLTALMKTLQQKDLDANRVISEALGAPDVPSYIKAVRSEHGVLLRVPMYTDIPDDAFLARVKAVIEKAWQVEDGGTRYGVEVEWRQTSFRNGPKRGDHINIRAHADVFPKDGGILTTGAESTHAVVGRFIALGAADTSYRTIAHEFGHILGFRDGYIRGYKDLANDGFEITELTPNFDDLMSAPRQGNVHASHFKLLLASPKLR